MDDITQAKLIERLSAADPEPFALLRRLDPETGRPGPIEVLFGSITEADDLAGIPLPGDGSIPDDQSAHLGTAGHDALALIPFRQLRERGFECHDDGTPLRVLQVLESYESDERELLAVLPEEPIVAGEPGFDISDEDYGELVEQILDAEIATGRGANFVIRRDFTARLEKFGAPTALSLFRRLLSAERGAYWTFVVYTGSRHGGRTLVGASPEAHVRITGDEVVMNPISGTYRYPPDGPSLPGLLEFLRDAKEADELSMVVDEELKMLCAVGDLGGQVHGPYLREMTHLAHTEFELRGWSTLDPRKVLTGTLFAATVTGSPLENACRVIKRYESTGRGYYAGALALFGRDGNGVRQVDSPILIRTADIDADGGLRMPVGATLVRDSEPVSETRETHVKAAGMLTALGVGSADPSPRTGPGAGNGESGMPLGGDARVSALLRARRENLSSFWLESQKPDVEGICSRSSGEVLVIDAEDTFTAMLAHLLRSTGRIPVVHRYDDPGLRGALDAHDGPVVLGPGPGDPAGSANPRMVALRELTSMLVERARMGENPVLGVCLGHQLLARELGLPTARKDRPQQGKQCTIDLFGSPATVGFYNSFGVFADPEQRAGLRSAGVELCCAADTGEVLGMRGPAMAGVQFHPESVLTLDGPALLAMLLDGVAGATRWSRGSELPT